MLVLGIAYFLLKPARYAILLWGPVIVYERMPALGKVGAAIVPTAFEVAGLLGPILIGFASDKLFGARRMPACVISLLALTVCLALFVPAMTTGSIPIVVGLLFMMGLTLYGPDSMICGSAAIGSAPARPPAPPPASSMAAVRWARSSAVCCPAISTPTRCSSASPSQP